MQPDEQRLHDYLDGRLDPEERARFESRLREDPALASRVEALRGVGAALRAETPELSPGFYVRARERFERGAEPVGFGFRLLSWETAGLTAAAVLALALFLPTVFGPRDPTRTTPEAVFAEAPEAEQKAVLDDSREKDRVGVRENEEQEKRSATKTEIATAGDEANAGRDMAFAPAPEPAAAPPTTTTASPSSSRRAETLSEVEAEAGVAAVAKEKGVGEARGLAADDDFADADRADAETVVHRAVEVPFGIVSPGGIHVVDERGEWTRMLNGDGGDALARLGGYDPNRRLVLVHDADAVLDCGSLQLRVTEDAYDILLDSVQHDPEARRSRAAPRSCALVLPWDGRKIRWHDEERP